ncbi:MAG: hypothetical protein N3D85_01985 [Candidatus Bathyarchaeota archaeon]|nr:hypothetical protein [Candidatus Bathyarchaeota archaeon]
MAINLDALLLEVIINVVVLSPVLWLSGRLLAGKDKAKFTDAIWIVLLGTIIGSVLGFFITGISASLILLLMWLSLIKHFFDCGWLKALAISIIAVLMFAVIGMLLTLVGIALGNFTLI